MHEHDFHARSLVIRSPCEAGGDTDGPRITDPAHLRGGLPSLCSRSAVCTTVSIGAQVRSRGGAQVRDHREPLLPDSLTYRQGDNRHCLLDAVLSSTCGLVVVWYD